MQDFAHIMEQGSRQQIWMNLPGSFQAFEYLECMGLFRRLHPLEELLLSWCQGIKQRLAREALVGSKQGIPELAGTIGQAGYHHGNTPAEDADRRIITL